MPRIAAPSTYPLPAIVDGALVRVDAQGNVWHLTQDGFVLVRRAA